MTAAFVGRTREIERLGQLPAGALATLWGPGGVGKTRLARAHADLDQRRGRNVTWVDLAGTRTRRDVTTAVATSLGVVPMAVLGDGSASDEGRDGGRVDAACRRRRAQMRWRHAERRGVNVRVILADTGWITANADAAAFLAAHDIDARQMKSPAVHVKVTMMHDTFEKDWATATAF